MGWARARIIPVGIILVVALTAVIAASVGLRNMFGYSPEQLAAPVTAGAALIAAATVIVDRPEVLKEYHLRAARPAWQHVWLPRLITCGLASLALTLATTHAWGDPWGPWVAIRNVLLLTSWALLAERCLTRAWGLAVPALWAGTLVVSSTAPPVLAAVWRAPLQPALSPEANGLAFAGCLLSTYAATRG